MNEQITELCLSLTREQRERLVRILTNANKQEAEKAESAERFRILLDVAEEMFGEEILTKLRNYHRVTARQFIAYQMKQEGYSYSAIGRLLGRSHSTVIRMCAMMDDVFRFRFQPEMKLWNQYQMKLKRYEDERKDREI